MLQPLSRLRLQRPTKLYCTTCLTAASFHDRLLDGPERVDIKCVECRLFGSPAVEQLRLNDRVHFDVHTCFTCQHGASSTALTQLTGLLGLQRG